MGGFDFRLSKAGYYGKGTYFASQACKSHKYAVPWHQDKEATRVLLVSRVVVGDAYIATKVDRDCCRPPVREGCDRCCDSVLARPGPMEGHAKKRQSHQEVVIFDTSQ